MITEFQMETVAVETASMAPIAVGSYGSSEMALLDDAALDLCSGGARNSGSSTSGFSRNRMAMTKSTFANAEGSGSFQSVRTEEVSSFAQENWDICQ